MVGPVTRLVLDLGTHSAAVAAVTDEGVWIVPDATSGAARWRCAVHWDGERMAVGALADHRRPTEPAAYAGALRSGLLDDHPVLLGHRRFRPVELLAEFVAALRAQVQRRHGPIDRALLTVPAHWGLGDPQRDRLLAAVEAAGFGAVELLAEPVAAACAPWPGPPLQPGDVALVFDLGATFGAALVRVGGEHDEIVGHTSIEDWGGSDPATMIDLTLASSRDVMHRLGVRSEDLAAVLPVGGGVRASGLADVLERELGAPVRRLEEPELAVVRGAAQWLPRSGPRTVVAPIPAHRLVPLSFTFPGGAAQLLRWTMPLRQPYDEGDTLARIRLAGGSVWDLSARVAGSLDRVLVGDGAPIASGEWLALARH
jgi:molecular chaperone DnaK (HSP70)